MTRTVASEARAENRSTAAVNEGRCLARNVAVGSPEVACSLRWSSSYAIEGPGQSGMEVVREIVTPVVVSLGRVRTSR